MQRIAILGSTGSIGINSLKVIDNLGNYSIQCLTARSNLNILAVQANQYKPSFLGIDRKEDYHCLVKNLDYKPKDVFFGEEGLRNFCRSNNCEVVVIAIVGFAGFLPLIESIKNNKKIILANKESLVCGGEIIMSLLKKHKAQLVPVDSEHNAVFQCLKQEDPSKIKRIILTASGGPFCDFKLSELKRVTPRQTLAHPRWCMGKKITVDSATLMNKGFEVIEAKWLFSVDIDKIEVLIHKEAVIHSMIEFIDGSILAQLSSADMRLPIQYALSFPERLPSSVSRLDFSKMPKLTFSMPDVRKFPCLNIAYEAARLGGTYPCVLCAADEELVAAYLQEKIKLTDIPKIISEVLSRHKTIKKPELSQIFEVDFSTRQLTKELIGKIEK